MLACPTAYSLSRPPNLHDHCSDYDEQCFQQNSAALRGCHPRVSRIRSASMYRSYAAYALPWCLDLRRGPLQKTLDPPEKNSRGTSHCGSDVWSLQSSLDWSSGTGSSTHDRNSKLNKHEQTGLESEWTSTQFKETVGLVGHMLNMSSHPKGTRRGCLDVIPLASSESRNAMKLDSKPSNKSSSGFQAESARGLWASEEFKRLAFWTMTCSLPLSMCFHVYSNTIYNKITYQNHIRKYQ